MRKAWFKPNCLYYLSRIRVCDVNGTFCLGGYLLRPKIHKPWRFHPDRLIIVGMKPIHDFEFMTTYEPKMLFSAEFIVIPHCPLNDVIDTFSVGADLTRPISTIPENLVRIGYVIVGIKSINDVELVTSYESMFWVSVVTSRHESKSFKSIFIYHAQTKDQPSLKVINDFDFMKSYE